MGNYLNIGNAGFSAIRKGIYIDKTKMIGFMNRTLGTKNKLTCVSRPRRFGKSFAAQMLCAYYDRSCDSYDLFKDLAISKDLSFKDHLNRYDVIYLDITWFISSTDDIKNIIHLLEEKVINELREAYPNAKYETTLSETMAAINQITGNKFIIIIDEWDALFREVKNDTIVQDEYIRFLRGLFKNSAFTDKIIEAAYMTGILPIKKYGTQSAMTDFKEYTMLAPKKLAEYVGFTESEVRDLCLEHDIDFEEIRKWYDGYSFNRVKSVYSPNSVIEAIENREFGNYWTQTETYESLQLYIDLDEDGLKEAILQMLGGSHIKVDVSAFQNDMTSIRSRDDVLTLLVHLGYLAYNTDSKAVYIPNEEIREEFVRAVTAGKHTEIAKLIRNSEHLLQATLNLDEEEVAASIEKYCK